MSSRDIIRLYDTHAHDYDRERGRSFVEKQWLDRFLCHVPGSGAILDIGCGVGEPIARHLIELGFEVTGVDSSPSMIEICRGRFPSARWLIADMRELDLHERFDGLIAWDSFFHLSHGDQRGMFASFARLAKPGAPLLFTTGPEEGEAIGTWQDEPLYHASLDHSEYRQLLDANAFDVQMQRSNDEECGDHSVWLATFRH